METTIKKVSAEFILPLKNEYSYYKIEYITEFFYWHLNKNQRHGWLLHSAHQLFY